MTPSPPLDTVPVPSPWKVTVRVTSTGSTTISLKVAVTVFAASMVTTQSPVPVHSPPQPSNCLVLSAGVAVSVASSPCANCPVCSAVVLGPAGVDETMLASLAVTVNPTVGQGGGGVFQAAK